METCSRRQNCPTRSLSYWPYATTDTLCSTPSWGCGFPDSGDKGKQEGTGGTVFFNHRHSPSLQARRGVAARQGAIQRHIEIAVSLPKGHPARKAIQKKVRHLTQEVSVIRAAQDFKKPPEQLSGDIDGQRRRVDVLSKELRRARGKRKALLIHALEKENRRLRELIAAAQVKVEVAQGVIAAPAVEAATVEDSTFETPSQAGPAVGTHAPRAVPDPENPYLSSNMSFERHWNTIPGLDAAYSGAEDEASEPIYKNPLFCIVAGLAVGWFIAKRM